VRLRLAQESRLRFAFVQEIYRLPEEQLVLQARAIGTGIVNGKPALPEALRAVLEKQARR